MKKIALIVTLFTAVGIMVQTPTAHAAEALMSACSGQFIDAYVFRGQTNMTVRSQSEDSVTLRGWLGGESATLTVQKENNQRTRLSGWLGSGVISAHVTKVSPVQTRIAGLLGNGESVSISINQRNPGRVDVGGFGPRGSVYLTFFRQSTFPVTAANTIRFRPTTPSAWTSATTGRKACRLAVPRAIASAISGFRAVSMTWVLRPGFRLPNSSLSLRS
jgi:hypothetical protein